jgi:hypothetical protein
MRVGIKRGAMVAQDFRSFRWPECFDPDSRDVADDPDMIFERGRRKDVLARRCEQSLGERGELPLRLVRFVSNRKISESKNVINF